MSNNAPAYHRPVLLLDEGLPYGLDRFLKSEGWDTEKVTTGTDDTEILKLAKERGLVVITQYKQLVSRLRFQRVKCVGIGVEDILPVVLERLWTSNKSDGPIDRQRRIKRG